MIALQPVSATQHSGAELIIHLLERQGVRIVAGIPGGALLPLYEALGRSTAIGTSSRDMSRRGLHRPGHGAHHGQSGRCASPLRARA